MKSDFTTYAGNYWWAKDKYRISSIYINGKLFSGIAEVHTTKQNKGKILSFRLCRKKIK